MWSSFHSVNGISRNMKFLNWWILCLSWQLRVARAFTQILEESSDRRPSVQSFRSLQGNSSGVKTQLGQSNDPFPKPTSLNILLSADDNNLDHRYVYQRPFTFTPTDESIPPVEEFILRTNEDSRTNTELKLLDSFTTTGSSLSRQPSASKSRSSDDVTKALMTPSLSEAGLGKQSSLHRMHGGGQETGYFSDDEDVDLSPYTIPVCS